MSRAIQHSAVAPIILGFSYSVAFWAIFYCDTSYGLNAADEVVRLRLRGGSSLRAKNISSGKAVSLNISAATIRNNRSESAKNQSGHPTKRRRPDEEDGLTPPQIDSNIPTAKTNENGEIYFEVM